MLRADFAREMLDLVSASIFHFTNSPTQSEARNYMTKHRSYVEDRVQSFDAGRTAPAYSSGEKR